MRSVLLAMILVFAVACGGSSQTLHGTIILQSSSSISHSGTKCNGAEGFSDVTAGAPVTVKNENGSVIATGSLDNGVYDPRYPGAACDFSFTIPNLPDANFYVIEVTHRGGWTYSQGQLLMEDWKVLLPIGD